MRQSIRSQSRREMLIATGTCAASLLSVPSNAKAQQAVPAPTTVPPWQGAINAVTGSAIVTEGRMVLDLPEIAENGNVVPFTVTVDSPMTEASYVKSLRIFSTANPQPLIATFRFSLDSGRAAVTSRIRLAASQDVIALAEFSDGTFSKRARTVKVTIGGCGG